MRKKIIAAVVIFALLLSLGCLSFARVLGEKSSSGVNQMARMYDLPKDSVDVLFLGTSHVWTGTQPALLWNEYGIAAYDLCAGRQPAWHTYYYLKEAFKRQSPKLVVLDTFGITLDWDWDRNDTDLASSLYGMRFSKDKVESLDAGYPKDMRAPFLMEYTQYHNRYEVLGKEDYEALLDYNRVSGDLLGAQDAMYITPFEDKSSIIADYDRETILPLTDKSEEYFRKIIELCRENGAELVLVSAPSGGYNENACWYDNYIEQEAADEGIEFYRFIFEADKIGIDWSHDMLDDTHLNHWGGQKYTRYMADNMLCNYDLVDHRVDGSAESKKYEYWNFCGNEYRNLESKEELANADCVENLLAAVEENPEGYYVTVQVATMELPEVSPEVERFLSGAGLNLADAENGDQWLISNGFAQKLSGDYLQIKVAQHELTLSANDGQVYLDNVKYDSFSAGLTITVFDAYTGEYVQQMGYSIYRNGL